MTKSFRTEVFLILKLHDIYKKYGLKLTYKVKHGELYHKDKIIYRAGCITRLANILHNYENIYSESYNKIFSRIEELSPNLIKVKVRR